MPALALSRRVRRRPGAQAVQILWLSVRLSAVGCSNNKHSSSSMLRPQRGSRQRSNGGRTDKCPVGVLYDSNFLTVPTISESLTGRARFVEVWPFTQGEIRGNHDRFIDGAFQGSAAFSAYQPGPFSRHDLLERVCAGGYPEVQRLSVRQRPGWFRDYVRTTIERDVVELSGIRKVAEMGQLLRLFAARTGCELVMQGIIDDAPLERQAVYDHRAWLETIHLLTTLPAWSRNLTRRVKRHPKVFLTDPGLAAWLLGKTPAALASPEDPATSQLIETFVFAELRRQLTWAATDVAMFHWQDRSGAEVDIVLESADGRVVGVEVKTHRTAKPEWFRWLAQTRDALGDKFITGIALYAGNDVLPFGDRLLAAPITALWELRKCRANPDSDCPGRKPRTTSTPDEPGGASTCLTERADARGYPLVAHE